MAYRAVILVVYCLVLTTDIRITNTDLMAHSAVVLVTYCLSFSTGI